MTGVGLVGWCTKQGIKQASKREAVATVCPWINTLRRVMSERQLHTEREPSANFSIFYATHTHANALGAGFPEELDLNIHTCMYALCVCMKCDAPFELVPFPPRFFCLIIFPARRWWEGARATGRRASGRAPPESRFLSCRWLLAESISLSDRAVFSIKDSCTRVCPSLDSFFGFFHLDLMHWS